MEKKNLGKSFALLAAIAALGGGAAIGAVSHAQTSSSATGTVSQTNQAPPGGRRMGHRPLGQDGIVESINGSTITIAEEADEGGATYTVDATGLDISGVKVSDKIFVDGIVTGNSVKATAVNSHFGGKRHEDAEDGGKDEGSENEAN